MLLHITDIFFQEEFQKLARQPPHAPSPHHVHSTAPTNVPYGLQFTDAAHAFFANLNACSTLDHASFP